MVWAVSRPVLHATQVSRILHESKILNDHDEDNNDFDEFDEDVDEIDQVMGLATIKRVGAPAPQVEGINRTMFMMKI